MLDPWVNTSGLIIPFPSRRDQVDMPRELNEATFYPVESRDPTPITFMRSPGLLRVP